MSSIQKNEESRKIIESVVEQVSKMVSEIAGIKLGPKQASMVESRLKSRMLKNKIPTFSDYLKYLNQNLEAESQALLSLLTTHHTFFFREFTHFEFLLNKCLKSFIETARQRPNKTIKIWSAACSKGQEVYSLAMFMRFHLSHMAPDVRFEIWGTDIDSQSVEFAKNAVYKTDELRQSPAMYLEGQWIRGSGQVQNFSKAKDNLIKDCHFEAINLLELDRFLNNKTFDLIFCRNVFIYFTEEQIAKITKKFMSHLDPQGFLFLGVSETLNGLGLSVDSVGPSIYQHKNSLNTTKIQSSVTKHTEIKKPLTTSTTGSKSSQPFVQPQSTPQIEKTLEILCIDDSPVIHSLLSKMLTSEHGFKIKAKANNGREALEILKTQKFDAITLDMHMPELDGVGFLKEYKDRSAPIIILSSVNRDDPAIAQKALSLGANDYVEKPSLENFVQASNEIRSKIKILIGMKKVS